MVHCRPEIGAPKSSPIDGSATLMTVVSMLTMNRLMQQTPRTRKRLRVAMKATLARQRSKCHTIMPIRWSPATAVDGVLLLALGEQRGHAGVAVARVVADDRQVS